MNYGHDTLKMATQKTVVVWGMLYYALINYKAIEIL